MLRQILMSVAVVGLLVVGAGAASAGHGHGGYGGNGGYGYGGYGGSGVGHHHHHHSSARYYRPIPVRPYVPPVIIPQRSYTVPYGYNPYYGNSAGFNLGYSSPGFSFYYSR